MGYYGFHAALPMPLYSSQSSTAVYTDLPLPSDYGFYVCLPGPIAAKFFLICHRKPLLVNSIQVNSYLNDPLQISFVPTLEQHLTLFRNKRIFDKRGPFLYPPPCVPSSQYSYMGARTVCFLKEYYDRNECIWIDTIYIFILHWLETYNWLEILAEIIVLYTCQ